MQPGNLLAPLPADSGREIFEDLVHAPATRIERIVSRGQHSPAGFWYDQEEDEWVLVLAGRGVLEFADGTRLELGPGDHVDIPAHCRHRVAATSLHEPTVWLAVYYRRDGAR